MIMSNEKTVKKEIKQMKKNKKPACRQTREKKMENLNIYQKITKIMEDVSYLQKDGTVKFNTTNYKYLSEEKITTAVRQSMIKHGLVMYPKLIQQLESSNEYLDEIIITYRLVNVEDPTEFIDIQSKGNGQDRGDKKTYKALTGAFKYLQRQTFMIPTGDDPDIQSTDENLAKIEKGTVKGNNQKFMAAVNKIKKRIPIEQFNILLSDFKLNNWTVTQLMDKTKQVEFYEGLLKIDRDLDQVEQ